MALRAANQSVKHNVQNLGNGLLKVIYFPRLPIAHRVDLRYSGVHASGNLSSFHLISFIIIIYYYSLDLGSTFVMFLLLQMCCYYTRQSIQALIIEFFSGRFNMGKKLMMVFFLLKTTNLSEFSHR